MAHVANDRPQPLVALAARGAVPRPRAPRRAGASCRSSSRPHSQGDWNVETVIGRFVDASWAYRFGPPAQDAIVVSVEQAPGPADASATHAGGGAISQAIRFPAGRPLERESPESLGLAARDDRARRRGPPARSHQPAAGLRRAIDAPGFQASDDGFFVEPGGARSVTLRAADPDDAPQGGRLSAVNMHGHVRFARYGSRDMSTPEPRRVPLYPAGSRQRRCSRSCTREPSRVRDSAVILCPPFGWEDMCSYRVRREWAEHLARGRPHDAEDRPSRQRRQRGFPRRPRPAGGVDAGRG